MEVVTMEVMTMKVVMMEVVTMEVVTMEVVTMEVAARLAEGPIGWSLGIGDKECETPEINFNQSNVTNARKPIKFGEVNQFGSEGLGAGREHNAAKHHFKAENLLSPYRPPKSPLPAYTVRQNRTPRQKISYLPTDHPNHLGPQWADLGGR